MNEIRIERAEPTDKRSIREECWDCQFKQAIPRDAHIRCLNPDPEMIGDPHGIRMGWFWYPLNFDPVWKQKKCCNFKEKEKK